MGKILLRCGWLALSALLIACGGGRAGGGGGNPAGADALVDGQAALQDEVERRFPFQPDQPLDQLFICRVAGSSLVWYLNLYPAGNLEVYAQLDNGAELLRQGLYSHADGRIALSINNDALVIDEVSTGVETALGMISRFVSPNLDCHTFGHRYNAQEFAGTVRFQCPDANIQAASRDVNAIEFVHAAVPFGFAVAGSAFRQRDRYVAGAVNPFIQRGYGVYRRDGDAVFLFFDLNQFDDFTYLSGRLRGGELVIDQATVAQGACPQS